MLAAPSRVPDPRDGLRCATPHRDGVRRCGARGAGRGDELRGDRGVSHDPGFGTGLARDRPTRRVSSRFRRVRHTVDTQTLDTTVSSCLVERWGCERAGAIFGSMRTPV